MTGSAFRERRLEADLHDVRAELRAFRAEMDQVNSRVAFLEGRTVAHPPAVLVSRTGAPATLDARFSRVPLPVQMIVVSITTLVVVAALRYVEIVLASR